MLIWDIQRQWGGIKRPIKNILKLQQNNDDDDSDSDLIDFDILNIKKNIEASPKQWWWWWS